MVLGLGVLRYPSNDAVQVRSLLQQALVDLGQLRATNSARWSGSNLNAAGPLCADFFLSFSFLDLPVWLSLTLLHHVSPLAIYNRFVLGFAAFYPHSHSTIQRLSIPHELFFLTLPLHRTFDTTFTHLIYVTSSHPASLLYPGVSWLGCDISLIGCEIAALDYTITTMGI